MLSATTSTAEEPPFHHEPAVKADEVLAWCGTGAESWADEKAIDEGWCIQGDCDLWANRDGSIPDGSESPLDINLAIHVFSRSDGTGQVVSTPTVHGQMTQVSQDFAPYGIQFQYTVYPEMDSTFRDLGNDEFELMKETYALDPSSTLNIFIVNGTSNLGGNGTFPWDPEALTNQGGVIIDNALVGRYSSYLTHEIGHCLGLWHTHQGNCRCDNTRNSDTTGDYCSDTATTTPNRDCRDPEGINRCSGEPWGKTDTQNFMSWASSTCMTEFSRQQSGRMHCWIQAALSDWIVPTSDAILRFDRFQYSCSNGYGDITLLDADLKALASVDVDLVSVDGHNTVTLYNDGSGRGRFIRYGNSLYFGQDNALTVSYMDESNSSGQPRIRQDTAMRDCTPPEISNVVMGPVTDSGALVAFTTSEVCKSSVEVERISLLWPGNGDLQNLAYVGSLSPRHEYKFRIFA